MVDDVIKVRRWATSPQLQVPLSFKAATSGAAGRVASELVWISVLLGI